MYKRQVEELRSPDVTFMNPFLALTNEEIMTKRLVEEFGKLGIPEDEIREAAHAGWLEMQKCREDIQKKGEETLEYLKKTGKRGIVLAGRPYHVDPEINLSLIHIYFWSLRIKHSGNRNIHSFSCFLNKCHTA